ncbi:hypothetical protein GJV26_06390 [Massilia dura]|uniref:DUF3761 domain-containing protein n=1 Tax=Pseudoduganella dura TaxID=321982 RepID=A0A6I3X8U2_9BURK|nr:hypothetical protein [Pseudoduganella dura]MUI12106.1 hypothetical protein [Pseudoduganella dura]GGX82045.1 hypothetical protein GCM10007386_11200 [Pseudoduganella dura]
MPPFRFPAFPLFAAVLAAVLACALVSMPVLARQDAAADRQAYASLPVCRLGADGRSLETEPCRTAPAQRPMPRRPVPQQDYRGTHIGIPDTTPETRPVLPSATLEPRSPYPAAPVPPVPPAVNPSPGNPSPYTSPAPGAFATPTPTRPSPTACVGNVCRDAAGTTFQGNGTGVTRSATGRHCTTVGGFVRCM